MEQNDKILSPTLLRILTKVAASLDGGIIGLNDIEVFGVLLDPNGNHIDLYWLPLYLF